MNPAGSPAAQVAVIEAALGRALVPPDEGEDSPDLTALKATWGQESDPRLPAVHFWAGLAKRRPDP